MDEELKPCPFCGSEAVMEVIPGIRSPITRWSVNCPNLDCGPVSESREEAVAWWNRRAAQSQPASETIREMAKLYAYSTTTGRGYIELEAEPQPASPAPMTLDEFFAEAERIGLTGDAFAAQLAKRPEFADCIPASPAPEAMARRFHEAYERLAPTFGYETRAETRDFNPHSPNGKLMIAVCASIAQPAAPEAIEDMCARIKAADDAAADGGYMLDSKDCISVLRGTWKGPLAMDMPAKPSTVEQAIAALVTALAASKGWMRDYADAIIRDAIDRRVPEAMSLNQASGLKDYELERFGGIDPSKPRLSQWEAALMNLDRASPAAPNESSSQPDTKNGAEAWKDVPRTGDWVADAGEVK